MYARPRAHADTLLVAFPMSTFTNIGFLGRAATHASQLFARAEWSDQCLPSAQWPSVVGAFCAPLVTRQPSTPTSASATSGVGGAGGVGGACVHSDVCADTPAAHADAMAALFGTSMHYGHSVARIKVMQALAILQNDLATGTTTALRDDLEKDVIAHMLVPMYQGAIQAAHKMDTPATAAAGVPLFTSLS